MNNPLCAPQTLKPQYSGEDHLCPHSNVSHNREVAIAKAEDKQEEIDRQQQEQLEYIRSVIETMGGAQSAQELKRIHDVAVRKLNLRKDTKGAEQVSLE